jgi:hypothetical protein
MIFIYHKIDDRFQDPVGASCDPDRERSWTCKLPGLIVSHKPWSTSTGIAASCIYFAAAITLLALVSSAARRAATLGGPTWQLAVVAAVSLLWFAWAAFETHHVGKTLARIQDGRGIKRGTIPAWLFTNSVFLVFTPVAVGFVLSTIQSARATVQS